MGIKLNVQWKFKVNEKKYGSVEEMPSDIREAYEKAKGTSRSTVTRIVFNGQEYQSIEAMPNDVRQAYDKVIRAAETGEIASDVFSGAEFGVTTPNRGGRDAARPVNTPRPIEPESILSLSPRMLIFGVALLILLVGLYYVIAR